MVHTGHGGSSASPTISNVAPSKPIAVNAGAQMQDANPLSANNNRPATKCRNDDLLEELCNLIKDMQPDKVHTFLDSNTSLDLNIVPVAPPGRELPLHLASGQYLDEQIVGRLLAASANPESFCGHGRNALQCIAYAGYLDCDSLGWLTRGYTREAKKKYIDSLDQYGDRRAAHYVAESSNQDLEGVSALGNAGVNWRLKNQAGLTPFEWAAKHGHWIIASELAKVLWNLRPHDEESDFSVCRWTQVNIQNTAYIQGLVRNIWNSPGQARTRDRILQRITPEFRFGRNPKDPVGGNGREPICIFKKLENFNFMSMVIPYFSTETTERIMRRTTDYQMAIKGFGDCSDSNFNYLGLQCVSTLDEYCHPGLNEGNLADRNGDQVLSRYQKEMPQESRVILTVPQLWIWTIDERVITAMQKQAYNVFDIKSFETISNHADKISAALNREGSSTQRPTFFADLFVGIMISECVDKLDSLPQAGLPESISGIFEKSISELSAKVREYTTGGALRNNNIDSETVFILQIGDIREELFMIQSVLFEQEQVWRQFMKARFPEFWSGTLEDQFVVVPSQTSNAVLEVVEILERPQMQFAKYKRRIAKLDADAERVESSIALQLDLKSKHASLQEAHLTTLMSAAVIGFTIVTIIFTPLAFLASLFALSTNQFQNQQYNSTLANGAPFYHGSYIGKWMVTVELASLTITGLAIWLALKFTTGFSSREAAKRFRDSAKQRLSLIKAWWKGENSQHTSNRPTTTNMARKERQPAAQQPAAARRAAIQGDGNQPIWNRFRIRPRGPRQQHVESGDGP